MRVYKKPLANLFNKRPNSRMVKSTDEKSVALSVAMQQESTELWKPVFGYEGFYEVSNKGRVKSLPRLVAHSNSRSGFGRVRERILKLHKRRDGYLLVCLYNLGKKKMHSVHRLIGYAFLGLTEDLQIDHKSGIKDDNRLENLRVVTRGENCRSYQKTYGVSKYRGVSVSGLKSKPWQAAIEKNGKKFHLGRFETEEEAALAYNEKATELAFNSEALNKRFKSL